MRARTRYVVNEKPVIRPRNHDGHLPVLSEQELDQFLMSDAALDDSMDISMLDGAETGRQRLRRLTERPRPGPALAIRSRNLTKEHALNAHSAYQFIMMLLILAGCGQDVDANMWDCQLQAQKDNAGKSAEAIVERNRYIRICMEARGYQLDVKNLACEQEPTKPGCYRGK